MEKHLPVLTDDGNILKFYTVLDTSDINSCNIATSNTVGIVKPDNITTTIDDIGTLSIKSQIINELGKSNIKLIVNSAYVDNLSFPESTIVRDIKIPNTIGINEQITIDNPFGNNVPVLCILEIFAEGKWGRPGCYHSDSDNYAASCECSLGTGLYISTGTSGLTTQIAASTGLGISTSWLTNVVSAPIRILVYKIGNETNVNSELEIFQSGIIKGQANALDFDFANVTVTDNKANISVDLQTNGHSSQPIGFTSAQPWTEKVVVSDAGVWLRLDGSPIDKNAYPEIINNKKIVSPASDIPYMTAPTTGNWTISASSTYDDRYVPWYSFDDNADTLWLSAKNTVNTAGEVDQWIRVHNTLDVFSIAGYAIKSYSVDPVCSWRLQASNDGTTWTTLDTQTNAVFKDRNEFTYFDIPKTLPYNYYQLVFTKVNLIANSTTTYMRLKGVKFYSDKIELVSILPDINDWYTYVKAKEAPYNEKFRGVPGKDALSKHMGYKLIVSGADTTTTGDFVVREPLLPEKILTNKEYKFPNPFGNISCNYEIEFSETGLPDSWFSISTFYWNNTIGVTLNTIGPVFTMTTGVNYITSRSMGFISSMEKQKALNLVAAYCRIHCWAIQSTPVFPYIYTTKKMSAVGDWETFNEITVPEDWHERNGELLINCRVTYSDFVDYVVAHPELCCTEAEWQAYSIAASGTGGVPFYVINIENDTIRLPDTRGDVIIHGTPPMWKSDAIRNITGRFTIPLSWGHAIEGHDALYCTGSTTGAAPTQGYTYPKEAGINASRTVPTDTTNHPRIISQLGCVCLKNIYLEPPRPNLGHIKEFLFESPDIGYEEIDGRILSDISTVYPDFVSKWLTSDINKSFLITDAQYQEYLVASSGLGGVPYFVYNGTDNTLRLPDMRGDSLYSAPNIEKFGKYENDAIRNIAGHTTGILADNRWVQTELFSENISPHPSSIWGSIYNATLGYDANIIINAAKVVPTDTTNHPRRVGVRMCIYLGRKAIKLEGVN